MVRVVPDLLRVFQKCACPLIIIAFSYNDFDVSRQMLVWVDGMLANYNNEMNVSMTSVIV